MLTQSQIKRCTLCSEDYPLTFEGDRCADDGGTLEVAYADRMIGALVGDRYQVESRVGAGSFSNVYLANDKKLKRKVAIKLMHAFIQDGGELLKRFLRETELMAGLQHPNLAVIYDSGALSNGQPYIAMEYLNGETLESIIEKEKRLSVKRTVGMISQVCDALSCAHKAGVIHRDLTPRNIFVLEGDVVKLIDFGLARCVDHSQSVTAAGDIVGTPQFMSPEQCKGQPSDHRADIYSVGLILHYMLSGEKPVEGHTLFEVLAKHANESPKQLSEVCPQLYFPTVITQAIECCVAKDPAERFSSCAELKEMISLGMDGSRLPPNLAKYKSNTTERSTSSGNSHVIKWTLALTAVGIVAVAGALTTSGINFFKPDKKTADSPAVHVPPSSGSTGDKVLTKTAPINPSAPHYRGDRKNPVPRAETAQLADPGTDNHPSIATDPVRSNTGHPVNRTVGIKDTQPSVSVASSLRVLPARREPSSPSAPHTVPVQNEHPGGVAISSQNEQSGKNNAAGQKTSKINSKLTRARAAAAKSASAKKMEQKQQDSLMQRQMRERFLESRKQADQAFNDQSFDVALMLYQQMERDLSKSGSGDTAVMIICQTRIITCMQRLRMIDQMQPTLAKTLAVLLKNMERLVNSIDCITWNELGNASYEVAMRQGPNAIKADYLDWAEACFELAKEKWDRPKYVAYRRMIGRYCLTLHALGKAGEAEVLERTEDPIFPERPIAPVNISANKPAPTPGSRQSRYIRNYHFH